MSKKNIINELYAVLISYMIDQPMTITLESRDGHKLWLVYKATHKQAETDTHTSLLFRGNSAQTITYLVGMRDLFTDILPN